MKGLKSIALGIALGSVSTVLVGYGVVMTAFDIREKIADRRKEV